MLVAKNEQGQSICLVGQQAVVGKKFFCPGCSSPVRLRQGKVVRAHFAHVSLGACHYFSENESAQHLLLKECLYQWGVKQHRVEVEKRLPEIEQIADIVLGDRLALEIQCSSLSLSRLHERTQAYQQAGYCVLWLLGERLWLKHRLTKLHKQFLAFSQYLGFFVWELDLKRKTLRLRYLIHEDLHGHLQCLTREFPLGVGDLLATLRFPYQARKVPILKGKQDTELLDYIARQLYHHSPKWMAAQAQLYQKGDNLLTKCLDDFYPQIRPPQSTLGFAQVQQDLTDYYANFQAYYRQLECREEQYLYPPVFYQRILQKKPHQRLERFLDL